MDSLVDKLKGYSQTHPITTLHLGCTVGLSLVSLVQPLPMLFSPFVADPSFLLYSIVPSTTTSASMEHRLNKNVYAQMYAFVVSSTFIHRLFTHNTFTGRRRRRIMLTRQRTPIKDAVSGFVLLDTSLRHISSFQSSVPVVVGTLKVHPLLFSVSYSLMCGTLLSSLVISTVTVIVFNLKHDNGHSSITHLRNCAEECAVFIKRCLTKAFTKDTDDSWSSILTDPLLTLFPII